MICEFTERIIKRLQAEGRADRMEDAIGIRPEVHEVLVSGNVPDDFVKITCGLCGAEGWVHPDAIPPGSVPTCSDCSRRLMGE